MSKATYKLSYLLLLIFMSACSINPPDYEHNSNQSTIIPAYCETWFDGCNTCTVENGAPTACTLKMCDQADITEAKCLSFSSMQQQQEIPKDCILWFDGCNRCIVEEGVIKGCTKMACIEKQSSSPSCKKYIE